MPQIKRAVVLEVDFGFDTIQGLMLPDGTYAIAVSQIVSQFSVSPTNASGEVKAILGKGFELTKTASDLNSRPVNTVGMSHPSHSIPPRSTPCPKISTPSCANINKARCPSLT